MIPSSTVDLQSTIQPVQSLQTLDARSGHASLVQVPAFVDPFEETWLDKSDQNLLIVSPYRFRPHLLDLPILPTNQQLLARALTAMQNVRSDYATCSYPDAFNWPVVIENLRALAKTADYTWTSQHFYIVVFRSQVSPDTDRAHLSELDQASHVEAMKSGGLLKYWFGVPDKEGRNVATCVWRKQADARPGSVGPGHKAAMRATMSMYTEWKVERLKLVISGDESGTVGGWGISKWVEDDG